MPTIKKFDRATIKNAKIGEGAIAKLADYAASLGLKVEYAGGAFDALSFTAKVRFTVLDQGATDAHNREAFNVNCGYFGLLPADFGATFTYQGEAWKIAGLALSRSKHPIRATNAAGTTKVFAAEFVAALINAKRAA